MAVLKKYNLAGGEVGEFTIEDALIDVAANEQMIKDYLVALRANARQWSASTQTRAEVNHSGKKPHAQKGTGRARQGYLGAPHYRGGGRVFAPRPKYDQHVRINKKERRAAIRYLLAEKIQNGCIHVLQYEPLVTPKTKSVTRFLQERGLKGKRVLFLGEGYMEGAPLTDPMQTIEKPIKKYENLIRSMHNLQRVDFMLLPNVNGYDVLVNRDIVIMEPALDELLIMLGGVG